jgi:wyosine [tRNA(Phe)-imidazoG37] synthetase (radical SAM superfamily)
VPPKTCSFDCVYCQLGRTTNKTAEIREYVNIKEILDELNTFLSIRPSDSPKIDYLTLSGLGEPTLNSKIGGLIFNIKQGIAIPVCVITNSSLLAHSDVRTSLLGADLIIPTLNAVTQKDLDAISRPDPAVKIEDIISGLIELRKQYTGKIWLEVMLIKGLNDDIRKVKKLREVIDSIRPDKVQLNSPIRITNCPDILSVDKSKLSKIRDLLGPDCEIL